MDQISKRDKAFLISLGTYLIEYYNWTQVEDESKSFNPSERWEYSFDGSDTLVEEFEKWMDEL